MNPSIGIVIPAYNACRFLAPTLDAILAQSVADWECVVVDDGSGDNTAALIADYMARDPRIRMVQKPNGGVSSARNRGFAELSASVKYVTFMDQDDVWLPDALEALWTELERRPDVIGVHGLADMIDAEGTPIEPGGFAAYQRVRMGYDGKQMVALPPDAPSDFASLVFCGRIYPPGVILTRREAHTQVGPWDATFSQVQDWDMCIRLSRLGPFHYLDKILVLYRRHERNGSNDNVRNLQETRRLYHKTFFAAENTEEHRRILRGEWKAWNVYRM